MRQDWSQEDKRGEMYLTGVDRDGSPSWTWRPALANPAHGGGGEGGAERRVRALVRMMERAWAVNPAAAEAAGVTVLCDCEGLSLGHYDHRAALAALAVLRVGRPFGHLSELRVLFECAACTQPVGWGLSP